MTNHNCHLIGLMLWRKSNVTEENPSDTRQPAENRLLIFDKYSLRVTTQDATERRPLSTTAEMNIFFFERVLTTKTSIALVIVGSWGLTEAAHDLSAVELVCCAVWGQREIDTACGSHPAPQWCEWCHLAVAAAAPFQCAQRRRSPAHDRGP